MTLHQFLILIINLYMYMYNVSINLQQNLFTCMYFQYFMSTVFGGVSYWLIGYALAFGEGNSFIGYTYFAHSGLPANLYAHWFFQFVFAATAATIVSGAVAERCDFTAYLIYSTIVTGIYFKFSLNYDKKNCIEIITVQKLSDYIHCYSPRVIIQELLCQMLLRNKTTAEFCDMIF